jgi:tRNA A-37 threonylcarbamoyl transferase component Bud32
VTAFLDDKAVERLRSVGALPDFSGTRYILQEFLARGGMGAVYAAQDKTLNRRVAIKVLDSADRHDASEERLVREARVLAQLEHPGIVPVHDAGTLADGRVFYVMKFVEGSRIDQFLASVPSLPERLRLFLRICETVSFAHSRGILHRDLKPSNVMVGAFGEVLVMDWGLAKILRPDSNAGSEETVRSTEPVLGAVAENSETQITLATHGGMILGTPGFMSPEQAQGKSSSLDVRSDIFSLGKLLGTILAQAKNAKAIRVPRALGAICEKAAAENPSGRYASVSALARDISRYLDGMPVLAYRENLWERAQRFYTRYQAAILLITVYLLMRAAFVFFGRR